LAIAPAVSDTNLIVLPVFCWYSAATARTTVCTAPGVKTVISAAAASEGRSVSAASATKVRFMFALLK